MPHIVLGDPSQREAIIKPDHTIDENYLGVWIVDSPDELLPEKLVEVEFKLMYWPEERYPGIAPGATFTLREGPNIVGFGTILSGFQSTPI
jgi:hypothetical protein